MKKPTYKYAKLAKRLTAARKRSMKKSMRPRAALKRATTTNRTRVTAGLGFPKQMTMTHRFVQAHTLVCTTGVMARQSMRANGMFDPDFTGVGHQPNCFDQMSALYNHYTVIGSKIQVRISNSSSSAAGVMLLLNDDSTIQTGGITVQAEQSLANRLVILPAGGSSRTLTKKFSAKKNFGGNVMSNPNLKGTPSADPFEQMFYEILGQPQDSTASISLQLYVYVEYIAIWTELKDIPRS